MIAAAVVLGFTAVLVAVRLGEESAAPVLIAGMAGYLLLAGYVLPWYFAGVLPVAALDGEAPLSRLLGVQTIAVLIAYQRQALPGGDGLDAVLSKATAGAQVIAVSACVVFLAGALAAARNRRQGTPALPTQLLH